MSAGTMNSVGGQLLAQGYAGMGDSLAQGIQQYAQNKRLDATTTGQIEALMQNGIQQGTAKNWSPQTQKLAQKLSQGSANLNDKMTLLGSLQTDQAMQTENLKRQAAQQELQMNQYRLNAIQGLIGGGQGQPQQSAPPMPASMPQQGAQNPPDLVTNFTRNYVRQTGTLPPPEAIGKVLDQQMNVEQPAGVVYTGPQYDANGNAKFDTYNRVYKKANGSTRVDNNTLAVPYHSAAPGTLLDSKTFMPAGQSQPDAQGVIPPTPGQPPVAPPAHIKTPEQDALVSDWNSKYQASLQLASQMQNVAAASQALDKSWLGGGPVMGSNTATNIRGSLAGVGLGSSAGQALDGANASVLNSLTGSLKGLTIKNQQEFNFIKSQLPQKTDAIDVRQQKAATLPAISQWMANYTRAVKDNVVAGMPEGEATTKAGKEVPFPQLPRYGQKNLSPQDQEAANWAKENPNDPRSVRILKNLGL